MSTHSQFPVLLSVDISETDDTYLIAADVKGFNAESVNVTSWQDSLIVNMTTRHESGQSYYLGELESEQYRRVIPLGFSICDDDFYTNYSSGTISIYVKKPPTRQSTEAVSNTVAVA